MKENSVIIPFSSNWKKKIFNLTFKLSLIHAILRRRRAARANQKNPSLLEVIVEEISGKTMGTYCEEKQLRRRVSCTYKAEGRIVAKRRRTTHRNNCNNNNNGDYLETLFVYAHTHACVYVEGA